MTGEQIETYIFSFSCPDKLGVVAKQSGLFYRYGAYITETDVYVDPHTERYFSRCVFDTRSMTISMAQFREHLAVFAAEFEMSYQLRARQQLPRVLIAVSKYNHCLVALLAKWRAQALPIDIVGVFSNHRDCRSLVEWHDIPFYYLPVTPETKPQQEATVLELMASKRGDLLVLARYMQILSDDLCRAVAGRAINIHHSFLPGFKGAKPYHQAYQRGVKVIGATAHYVTPELDEGPIICQEVRAIDHAHSVADMVRLGHDTEAVALSHAVRMHCDQRVLMNNHRTVTF